MDVTWLGWIGGLLGLGFGLYFMQLARSSAEQARRRSEEAAAALVERDRARTEAQERVSQQRERAEELVELRHRVEKLKKRARDAVEEHKGEPERLQALEGQLAQLRRDLEAARRDQEQARRDQQRAETLREQDRRDLEVQLEQAARGEELDALRVRAEQSELRGQQLEARATKAEADVERLHRRWESVDRAYMILRGEKAALEDELRTKTERIERLEALKVALADSPVETVAEPLVTGT